MDSKLNKIPTGTWRHTSIFKTLKQMWKKEEGEEE